MVDLSLPAKPTTALPSLKDAVDANYRRAVPMMPITFGALYSQFHPSSSPPPTSKKRKLGDESTAADNELAEKRSKPSPVDAPNKTSTYRPQAQPSNDKGSASAAQAPRYPEHPTNSGLGLNYTDNRRFGPTSCSIRYDPVTRSFHPTRPLAFQSFLAPPTSVAANGGSTTTMQSTINTQTNGTKHHEPVEHRYNLRKRKAPAEDKDQDISAPAPKRLNQKATSNNSKECDNQQQQQPIAKPTTPVKKKSKHRPHSRKKAKSQAARDLLYTDLIPHYRPTTITEAVAAPEPKKPVQFMDFPAELRLKIWANLFEDESYAFTLKKHCTRDSYTHMIPTPPPSIGAMLINRVCNAEIMDVFYKLIRLELNFGRLRPPAMRDFLRRLIAHPLGLKSERIFFIKKFGLQKINLGLFPSVKEIVSTHWTVEGDAKMDEEDYKNNRIDPAFVLRGPASKPKLKGLTQRRYWADQRAAAERFERHTASVPWCHPLSKDPKAADFEEGDKKECPFLGLCENMKGVKFCMVVKYKFGCVRGRHARHKEVLYLPHDDELAISLLTRAHNSGFTACILTTDTWQLGWRHDDVATSNYAFYRGIGADLGLTDPVFQKRLREAGIDPKKDPEHAAQKWIDENVWHGRAFTWEKMPWLIKTWKDISGGRPFLIKGIQSVHDAQKCVEVGCDGIVVSNHAGRQVDGAVASLDALESIIDAGIGEKLVVTFDSGVRGAGDVIKALCLGAKFVWVGRLWIWGLSIMGEEGVRHVMRSLLAEFDISMAVGGFRNVGEFTRDRLESYVKSYSLIDEKAKL